MQTDLSFYQILKEQITHTECVDHIDLDLTCIDLFAGCGGFSLGMSHAGYNMIAAVEKSDMCCETLRHNAPKAFPNMKIINEDITKLSAGKLLKISGIKKGELSLMMGGPPCQGFSFMNTERSLDDPRSKLVFEYLRILKGVMPKMFLIENVPGLLAYKDFFIEFLNLLEGCGYNVRFLVMDFCSHGVPQHRKRVMIEGVRNDLNKTPEFPAPTHFDKSQLVTDDNMFTQAEVAIECFKHDGFTKEEVKDVWFNTKLSIMMNRKTASAVIDRAISSLIGQRIGSIMNPGAEVVEDNPVSGCQTEREYLLSKIGINKIQA